ncbi:MAG: hypothetical protein OEY37_08680 [Gammaproteobacteria bacterium]|nr:hypothetical protein [Gammaproteobacteria bacterium]MDH5617620.1 hypothetical protein [Gammaproteobacteria bacterium]
MAGDKDDLEELEDEDLDDLADADDDDDDDVEITDFSGDTIVGLSGEFDIDTLVKRLEATDPDEVAHRREIRRRLEEIREMREVDLDSTFNFNLDDDS